MQVKLLKELPSVFPCENENGPSQPVGPVEKYQKSTVKDVKLFTGWSVTY